VSKIHLNGRLIEAVEARIDPADRGFLLSDGLFETLRVYGGRPFCMEAHLARLAAGAAILGLPMPAIDEITTAIAATLRANALADAALRITLTRGVGPRGLLPPAEVKPTLLVTAHPLPSAMPAAMSACLVETRRNEHSALSRLKSLAYLDNILALREAAAAGCEEAILFNTAGRVAGGSRSNLFLVLEGVLTTPPPSEGVLAGVARQTVLELAAANNTPAREAPITRADLERASEAFLTNSLIEIVPVTRLYERALAPGPFAARLAQGYAALTKRR
jgi:branched-chain amino acid aminotransferase